MTHTCERCQKSFKYYYLLKRHKNSKRVCRQVDVLSELKDTTNELKNIINELVNNNHDSKLICKYCNHTFSRTNNLTQHLKNGCKMKNDKVNIYENELNVEHNNDNLICRFCKTTYKHLSSYSRHMNAGCKERDEYEQDLENKVINRREQAAQQIIHQQTINNNTNNSTTNNTINIHLPPMRAFGEENHDYITTKVLLKELLKCKDMNDLSNVVGQFTKMIHCDPAHPENHNVALQSLNGGFAKVFNGKTFESRQASDVQDTIIQNIGNLITEKCDEVEDCSDRMFNKLERTRETIDEDIISEPHSGQKYSTYRAKVKTVLHNNKRTINSTQNLIEEKS